MIAFSANKCPRHPLFPDVMNPFVALADATLVERVLAGEKACFDILVERHIRTVRALIRSMVANTSDTDDLVQETFLKAWRRLETFRSESTFRTWLLRVATNEVLQYRRCSRRAPVQTVARLLENHASADQSPFDLAARAECCESLARTVATLPAKYRTALILCGIKEVPVREAAARLRSGIPMLKSRLLRARRMVRRSLQAH